MRNRIEWTPPTNIIRSGELDFDLITGYSYHNWALGASGDIALYTHLHPVRSPAGEWLRHEGKPNAVGMLLRERVHGAGRWTASSCQARSRCR